MRSLPTSTKAARGSTTNNLVIESLHSSHDQTPCHKPDRVLRKTNLSNGKLSSPKCALVRDRNQSRNRAVNAPEERAATLLGQKRRSTIYPCSWSVCSFDPKLQARNDALLCPHLYASSAPSSASRKRCLSVVPSRRGRTSGAR